MIDQARAIEEAERFWAAVLTRVTDADLDEPGGCGTWSNRELINHVIGGGHRYAMLLDGATAAQTAATRDTDYVGTDPLDRFWEYARMAHEAAETADLDAIVDHRAGRRTGHSLLTIRVAELALHARDLCVGIGAAWEPPSDVVEYLLDSAAPEVEELRAQGLFGPALTPASDSAADRLLAFTGRA
ncbi:TIGR03086 family protein [Gordonia sp. X0973]|uniref:TIGR03086 family metal-binding protein n=1 Tax=Gordonia sp. X0973 TaxID=2742602 RepID=UPI000F545A14|nr:TIGR03086 family metal-binding protein [Gordonia sp. X0973]QKT07506.1 TIGR03086 family protein [Gordonia sp. X0973]